MAEHDRDQAPAGIQFLGRTPGPPLAPHVRSIWTLRGSPPGQFERILPQPVAHLIVNLAEPYRLLRIGRDTVDEPFADVFVSALQRQHLVIRNPPELWQCGAELAPYGLTAFTSTAATEFAGRVRPAADVVVGSGGWRDRLRAAGDSAEALDAFEELLLRGLRPAAEPDPIAAAACARLDADPDMPIADLGAVLGVSPGRLVGAFRRACGLTPKAYADLVRFHRFIAAIPFDGTAPRWADLVADTGYYDQPHFIRSFKRFTGYTPSEYVAGVREHGAAFALFVPMREA